MKDILQKIRLPASPAEIAVADAVGAQLMALRPDSLRITLMHSEQKEATYNLGKGAGLQGPAGTPAEHFFTSDEAIGLVPFLLQENSNQRGYNIFITPFSASVWYILLDDILPAKIAELAQLRLTPQLLIESSPQRFQGIYLLPRECATKDEANNLFRLINARHGDPKNQWADPSFPRRRIQKSQAQIPAAEWLLPIRWHGLGRETAARGLAAAAERGEIPDPGDSPEGASPEAANPGAGSSDRRFRRCRDRGLRP